MGMSENDDPARVFHALDRMTASLER